MTEEKKKKKKNRMNRLTDATKRSRCFVLASGKSQKVWASLKIQWKKMSPLPDVWALESSELNGSAADDEEDGLFCDSLLGLMRKYTRYDFLKTKSRWSALKFGRKKQNEVTMNANLFGDNSR